jgi:predicted alpha-1,6-mannanase (GH76 family)
MKKLIFFSFVLFFLLQSGGVINAQKQKVLSHTSEIISGGIYKIVSKASNKSLDVVNSSLTAGAGIDTWTNTKTDAERWIVTSAGNNLYTIINVASGLYLRVGAVTIKDGTTVNQHLNVNNNYVKWAITPLQDGNYTILSGVNTAYCLNEVSHTAINGSAINLYTVNGTDSQSWSFELQTSQDAAPTLSIADQTFSAWRAKYYDKNKRGNEVIAREGFWSVAEMMEIVDDAYEVTGYSKYVAMFDVMFKQFLSKEGSDWMWNEYNDDITWMVIACTRATLLTGNTAYAVKAKEQFDKMYVRAIHAGDWLTWKQGTAGTNSCINGPAMVACCYLAEYTGDKTYYDKAIALYNWSKNKLFDPKTGKVNDSYNNVVTNSWSSTYNQGTYLGAALMLYKYTNDNSYSLETQRIARYTRVDMANNGVFDWENGPDLNGFKGILQRYTRKYVVDLNRADYIPWLQLNAKVAYNNRNSEGLIYTKWGTRTMETATLPIDTTLKYVPAFAASTAVSLLVNCPFSTTLVKSAFSTIEAENFDYLKGVIVESGVDGSQNLGNVKSGYYTAYNNVDFGLKGSASVELRLSGIQSGNTIEIRLGSVTGELIGTVAISNTTSWNVYQTVTATVQNIKGLQNIYLVYKGTNYICKLDNIKFVEADSATESNGLLGTYYSGITLTNQLLQRIDKNIDYNWAEFSPASTIPADNFSARWIGKIQPRYTGVYTFYITSGNGRRVWVNNKLIIDKWISNSGVTYSGVIDLVAGEKYDIKIEYYASTGNADIKLEWESAEQTKQVVPTSQLYLPDLTISAVNNLQADANDIVAYMNISKSQLLVNSGCNHVKQLSIYDIQGQLKIKENNQFSGNNAIDISHLGNGVYFVSALMANGTSRCVKFIK